MGLQSYCLFAIAVFTSIVTSFPSSRHISREADAAAGFHIAPHVVNLRRTKGKAASSRFLAFERSAQAPASALANIRFLSAGAGYGIDLTFGREDFTLIFDTGSSDMWLPKSGFKCVGPDKKQVPTEYCGIGNTCDSNFSGGTITDQNFNITYGHGEFVIGTLGYERVTIAGITVPKQEAALCDYGFWLGDNQTSGLMGWSFPTLTNAYRGTDPSKDSRKTVGTVEYNPFIFNAIDQAGVKPMFGYALDQRTGLKDGGAGGQLAIGGVPNVAHGPWISTPIRIIKLSPNAPAEALTKYTFYTIIPEGFQMANAPTRRLGQRLGHTERDADDEESHFMPCHNYATDAATAGLEINTEPMIVDSGTTVTYVPRDVAVKYASMTKPAAVWNSEGYLYQIKCDGKVPNFALKIGGKDLWVNREDLLLTGELGQDPYDNTMCNLGIQPAPGPPFVLGDTFLRSVVTVHDLGQHLMWFAQRDYGQM